MNTSFAITFTLLVAFATGQRFEFEDALSHRRQQEQTPALPPPMLPRITFRKLHPDPEHCYQMTWDYEWGYKSKSICRGSICKGPFFSGETEPDVKSNAAICKLEYGETCVKHVKYDKYDKKTPTFIARYCGRGQITNDGSRASTSCHTDNHKPEKLVVCFCKDNDKCNSAKSIRSSLLITISSFIFFINLVQLAF